MAEKEAKKPKKNRRRANIPSAAAKEAVSCYSLAATQPSRAEERRAGVALCLPPPSHGPVLARSALDFPRSFNATRLKLEGGGGERNPFLEGGREGGSLVRSLSIVRELPYVLDPDSDPGAPNPDEIFAKVKTRSGCFASRLFHHFSNVGWHRASTFTQGSFALLSSCILCSYSEQVTRTHTSPPPRILPLLPSPLPRGKRKVGSLNIGGGGGGGA